MFFLKQDIFWVGLPNHKQWTETTHDSFNITQIRKPNFSSLSTITFRVSPVYIHICTSRRVPLYSPFSFCRLPATWSKMCEQTSNQTSDRGSGQLYWETVSLVPSWVSRSHKSSSVAKQLKKRQQSYSGSVESENNDSIHQSQINITVTGEVYTDLYVRGFRELYWVWEMWSVIRKPDVLWAVKRTHTELICPVRTH